MNKEFKDTMEKLHFSEEQKENMVQRLMDTQMKGNKKCRPFRKHSIAAGIVAAAVVLTMGAGAVYSGLASDAFANLFGTSHTEIIDKIGRPIGVSDSDAGITITVDAILGDKHNLNIVYTLAKEDGTPWEVDAQDLVIPGIATEFANYRGGMGGGAWFTDENPQDNKIQYFEQLSVSAENGIPMGRAKAVIEDLCVWNEETGEMEKLVEGTWKLKFDLQYEDSGISLIEQPILVETSVGTARIESFDISPIGFYVKGQYDTFKSDFQREIDAYETPESGREPENYPFRRLTDIPVVLHLKDGTELNLQEYAGSSGNLKNGAFTLESTFEDNKLYHLSEMESVTIADVTIPIPEDK